MITITNNLDNIDKKDLKKVYYDFYNEVYKNNDKKVLFFLSPASVFVTQIFKIMKYSNIYANDQWFIAYDTINKNIVGFSYIHKEDEVATLVHNYVVPSMRMKILPVDNFRNTIMNALTKKALTWASENGCTKLETQINKSDVAGIKRVEKRNWYIVDETESSYFYGSEINDQNEQGYNRKQR